MKTSRLLTFLVTLITMTIVLQDPADARHWRGWRGGGNSGGGNTTPDPNPEPDPEPDPETDPEPEEDPVIPMGYLNAFPTVVRTGTYPTLDWAIDYPETITDVVNIDSSGTVTMKEDVTVEIRVLGASYQTSTTQFGTVDGQVIADGLSSWTRFFYDIQTNVDPTQVYHSQEVRQNRTIDFRARCHNGSYWKPFHESGTSSPNVVILANGDTPPDRNGAFNQQNVEEFIRPYVDDSGKIEIGPKDLIVCFELGQTDTSVSGFDQQDLVLLATFITEPKTNNGHGNNIDGVDMSNPGAAPFSGDDSDPTDDDEGSGGGAYPSLN